MLNSREVIAKRVAQELKDGDVINLGIGIPTLVASYIEDKEVYLQSENGIVGLGPRPTDQIDPDLTDAGKKPATASLGAAIFDSAASFSMIRGGHIDVAILGTLQIDRYGEIANWAVPNQPILGVGGALDLLAGAKKIIVAANLFNKEGESKLVNKLTYKTSGERCVDLFVNEYAMMSFSKDAVIVEELLGDLTFDQLASRLSVPLVNRTTTTEAIHL